MEHITVKLFVGAVAVLSFAGLAPSREISVVANQSEIVSKINVQNVFRNIPKETKAEAVLGIVPVVEAKTEEKPPAFVFEREGTSEIVIDSAWSKDDIRDVVRQSNYSAILYPLVECESQFTAIKRIDSNGYYSYGILQYQSSTWNGWSKESGIRGDAMNPPDAIRMFEWAYERGLLHHWSCARILGMLK